MISNYENTPPLKIIFVGSLIKRKGLDLIFNALGGIKDKDWILKVAGEGHEKKELIKQAEKIGIKERITFLGFIDGDRLIKEYKDSDLFILPTREDCYGLVILEAMCCGLPVISSKYADGSYDLVENGMNGYIVDPENETELKEKICLFLKQGDEKEKMGKAGRKKAEGFSFENVSKGFMEAVNIAGRSDK